MKSSILSFGCCGVLLSACAAGGPIGENSRKEAYVKYSVCTELQAGVHIAAGMPPSQAIDKSIQDCDSEASLYLTLVESAVKSRNGWSSLDPSVRPALRNKLSESTKRRISSKIASLRSAS